MGPFWEDNKDLLRKIVSLKIPPSSILNYSEYGADYLEDLHCYLVYMSAFRLSGTPYKFTCVNMEARLKPKTLDVEQEVIKFSADTVEYGCQITLKGKEVGPRHKKWLRSVLEKNINTSLL